MHGSFPNTMDRALGAWCIGVVAPLSLSGLFQLSTLMWVGVVVALGVAWRRSPGSLAVGALFLGFAYGTLAGHEGLAHRLPECAVGPVPDLQVRILTVSGADGGASAAPQVRVDVAIEAPPRLPGADHEKGSAERCAATPRRARLSWFRPKPVAVGERWRLDVRLRRPRGFQNRGGFDYEGWLFGRSLDAVGYIRDGHRLREAGAVAQLRQSMRSRLYATGLSQVGYLDALIFGAGGSVSREQWDVLRRTGTVHLMVVSGLHIGLVAALGYAVGRWGLSLPFALRRLPARRQGTVLALLAATGYSALAGWSLPVQRAWLMAVVIFISLLLGRRIALTRWFLLVLAVVLTHDPLAPTQTGFWLSFGAVAILLAAFSTRPSVNRGQRLLFAQGVLFVAMAPLLAGTLGVIPTIAPLANLVAVPVVSLLVVPPTLLGGTLLGIAPPVGMALLGWADAVLSALGLMLERLAEMGRVMYLAANASRPDRMLDVGVGVALVALLLVPAPRLRRAALGLALIALPQAHERPPTGEFELTMLDVGQGLAVHVQSARHDLVYDAGASYPSGFDLGEAVVGPALKAAGVSVLDALLVSHSDNDHSGGAAAVVQRLTPRWIVAAKGGNSTCRGQRRWQWDGVVFEQFQALPAVRSGNDGSCVVRVDGAGGRALLSGDIEADAERALVRHSLGPVAVMTAPHHGSATSSTRTFLRHVRPRWVLISSGHRNRFGHPHKSVVARYEHFGARWATTARDGSLHWSSARPETLTGERNNNPPYWRIR